ncbi:MAG: exo-alpha-sialidase [Clostridia bacterium]|nr:exo-alpha-sialidase [Clostridia bacterium]
MNKRNEYIAAGDNQRIGGVTDNAIQPFKGVPDADIIRIPGIIQLHNGDLFLSADMRYAAWTEAGGIDTVITRSTDGGKTWRYSWPIYFPDSTDSGKTCACTAIDSMCVQGPDGTIYLAANVSPTGISCVSDPGFINPKTGRSYVCINGVDRLVLTDSWDKAFTLPAEDDGTVYAYYVGDYADGYAPVLRRADGSATDWVVDDCLNIYTADHRQLTQEQYSNGEKNGTLCQQNLLYKDSVLHVFNTQYLWLATSKNNGESWSHSLLAHLKKDSERELRHGTGHGITTADGTVVMPGYNCVEKGGDSAGASVLLLYTKDNGKTWHRSGNEVPLLPDALCYNECETVELADGTLRTFLRADGAKFKNMLYADAVWDEGKGNYFFSTPVKLDIEVNLCCKMSAIAYSRTINGWQAVLTSYPCAETSPSRDDGKIFLFLVKENNEMELFHAYDCPKHYPKPSFGYSNMTELQDGRVAIWYEPTNHIEYIPIEELAPDAVIGDKVQIIKKC